MSSLNSWVESYLDALLRYGAAARTPGPRSEATGVATASQPPAGPGAAASAPALPGLMVGTADPGHQLSTRFFVNQIISFQENELYRAWRRAITACSGAAESRATGSDDDRVANISWRLWSLKRRKAALLAQRAAAAWRRAPGTRGATSLRPGDRDRDFYSPAEESLVVTPLYTTSSMLAQSQFPGSPPAVAAASAAGSGDQDADHRDADGVNCTSLYSLLKQEIAVELYVDADGNVAERERSLDECLEAVEKPELFEQLSDGHCPIAGCACNAQKAVAGAGGSPGANDDGGVQRNCKLLDQLSLAADAHNGDLGDDLAGSGGGDGKYVVMISLHGLVRGDQMELGRDADTGGQVKYVVELARAMAQHPSIHRVDLLTRRIAAPDLHPIYSEREEVIWDAGGDAASAATAAGTGAGEHERDTTGGARIVRLDAGPPGVYITKEKLWPFIREFADRALEHIRGVQAALARAGRSPAVTCIHGHYADAGEIAALLSATLDVPMVATGHSLGRNKLEHLLTGSRMRRSEIEEVYNISRRIEAEERVLDAADVVFVSTQQEIEEQWGIYDGFDAALGRALSSRRLAHLGRWMPRMFVISPGLQLDAMRPATIAPSKIAVLAAAAAEELAAAGAVAAGEGTGDSDAAGGTGSEPPRAEAQLAMAAQAQAMGPPGSAPEPPIWAEIARFLSNPRKPAVLAIARPDAKKNLVSLVAAFGECRPLRDLANLVLFVGNRDTIDEMAPSCAAVVMAVIKTIDAHDLWGSVALPKHHGQGDIGHIYRFAAETRGMFVNAALQEPFGLTLVEAASAGVPTVATCHGGPVDIHRTLRNGILVEPTDTRAIGQAILMLLTNAELWEACRAAGLKNIVRYSWRHHCQKYLAATETARREMAAPLHLRTLTDGGDDMLTRAQRLRAQHPMATYTSRNDLIEGAAAMGLGSGAVPGPEPAGNSSDLTAQRTLSMPMSMLMDAIGEDGSPPSSGVVLVPQSPGPAASSAADPPLTVTPPRAVLKGISFSGSCDRDAAAGDHPRTQDQAPHTAPPKLRARMGSMGGHELMAELDRDPRREPEELALALPKPMERGAFAAAGGAGGTGVLSPGPDAMLSGPRLGRMERLVMVAMEAADARRGAANTAARLLRAVLHKTRADDGLSNASVGVGVLSVASFEQTRAALAAGGVALSELDVVVVAAGAEIYLTYDVEGPDAAAAAEDTMIDAAFDGGRGSSGNQGPGPAVVIKREPRYGRHVEFRWSQVDMCKGVLRASVEAIPAAATGAAVAAVAAGRADAGVTTNGSVAAAGLGADAAGAGVVPAVRPGPRAGRQMLVENPAPGEEGGATAPRLCFRPAGGLTTWSAAQTERLRRRLRKRGYRCRLLLEHNSYYLHVLPLRASRALALRWLCWRVGPPLESVLCIVGGDADGDAEELLMGTHRVVVLGSEASADGNAAAAAEVSDAAASSATGGSRPSEDAADALAAQVAAAESERVVRAQPLPPLRLPADAAAVDSEGSALPWDVQAILRAMDRFGF